MPQIFACPHPRGAAIERRLLRAERKPPRSELLPEMADVLCVEIIDLLKTNGGGVAVQRSSRPPVKL